MTCIIKDFDGICTLTYGGCDPSVLCVDANNFCVCDDSEDCYDECENYESEDDDDNK